MSKAAARVKAKCVDRFLSETRVAYEKVECERPGPRDKQNYRAPKT